MLPKCAWRYFLRLKPLLEIPPEKNEWIIAMQKNDNGMATTKQSPVFSCTYFMGYIVPYYSKRRWHDDVIKWKYFRVTGPLWWESIVTGEISSLRPAKPSFDIFFDLHLNKRLSKQSLSWWFETPKWLHPYFLWDAICHPSLIPTVVSISHRLS